MLEISAPSAGLASQTQCDPHRMTWPEQQMEMAAWATVASPLILSFDVTNLTEYDMAWPIISNREALAINSEWAGPARVVLRSAQTFNTQVRHGAMCEVGYAEDLPNFVVFGRPLPEGRFAAVAINLLNSSAEFSVPVEAMGFGPSATLRARNVWAGADAPPVSGAWDVAILEGHGHLFFVFEAAAPAAPPAPVPVPVPAPAAAAAPAPSQAELASFLSATHWSPCYFISAEPSLLDGCAALARTGTTSIKLIFSGDVENLYPWNTDWPSIMAGVKTLTDLARTDLYDMALRGRATLPAFNYSTFSLITYGLTTAGWDYWCTDFSDSDAALETAEFSSFTAHLLSIGGGKRFMLGKYPKRPPHSTPSPAHYHRNPPPPPPPPPRSVSTTQLTPFPLPRAEHWEGDWAARCGSYDASKRAAPEVQARMTRWLAARQAGVDAGRRAWCRAAALGDCDARSPQAIHAAAGAEVFHATEVNLVWDAMTGFPENINVVVPAVALDMISYSSYDTMFRNPGFAQALDYIASKHNRTAASPSPAVFVAEFGVAQNEESAEALLAIYANVAQWAFSTNAQGVRRASNIFAWELFDNEVNPGKQFPGGRCNNITGPQFNASDLHGFWLIRPDGSTSPSFDYLASIINGSAPMPSPPGPGPQPCTFVPDTDVTDVAGGFEVAAASEAACCAACWSDARCTSAVFTGTSQQCWAKYGGRTVSKKGVTQCLKQQAGH